MNNFLHSAQKGFAPILLVIAVVGVLSFVLITGLAPFKNNLFASLFQKNASFAAGGPGVSNIVIGSPSVKVYEKEEIKFDVATNSQYPFMAYDPSPPPGVIAGQGITVEGVFTANGKTWKQPAFYMTETVKNGSGSSMYFTETGKKYWALRFSPQETGTYSVVINATDASGTSSTNAGSFTATAATKKGFIKVSQQDTRYFEFSNGELYYPIGPANLDSNNSYTGYKDNGPNFERPWLGGIGVYSTNWARWKSSAEGLGNEGIMTRLNWQEKLPGHDLSYELFYPTGDRFWIGTWLDDMFGPRVVSGKKYAVKFVYKTANIAGPRVAGQPYGLTVKTSDYAPWGNPTSDVFDSSLRGSNTQILVPQITTAQNWTTINVTFTANANRTNIYVYLDNVTAGNAYIDELSIKECVDTACTNLGGEIVRNSRADEHLFIEQRPAAFMDWQVDQGDQNGVFFKYVVHDKNDWIQNHLKTDGSWAAAPGDGYYQDENTKARWLLRQWYRYLIARWGYSTAIHSWELNNEGPPNEEGNGTAVHWKTAQAFAKYMHDNDAHRHLATTSFWCCWRPAFWGNNNLFPDIDYADLHMYTDNTDGIAPANDYDMAMWTYLTSMSIYNNGYPAGQKGVGKPIMRGETGVSGAAMSLLSQPNPGIWYHNLLWGQLNEGAMIDSNYWWGQHFAQINRSQIAKPFWLFVKDLDLNKGGYSAVAAASTNTNLRVFGQKNLTGNKAQIWIQNATHTWKNVMDGVGSVQSGNITVTMKPSNTYIVESWNTYTGVVSGTQSIQSDTSGKLIISISNLSDDVGIKISGPVASSVPSPSVAASASQVVSPSIVVSSSPAKPGDIDGNNKVDIFDYNILLTNFGK